MGQVLKREHGGRRAAFAALLTTGMLAALLALTGIAAPAPAYAADQLKGTGTADDPVLIYTTDDLIAWCDRLNAMGEVQERQQHARLRDQLIDVFSDQSDPLHLQRSSLVMSRMICSSV